MKSKEESRFANKNITEEMKAFGQLLREVQMGYNNVISESSAVIELPPTRSQTKVEIKAMACCTLRVCTVGHYGPIRVQLQYLPRSEQEQKCFIGRDPGVCEENCIFEFVNKTKFTFYPKSFFDIKYQQPNPKNQQNKSGTWQPPYVYMQF